MSEDEIQKLHRRAIDAEEALKEVAQIRPHQMYWVHRAKAAEAKVENLEGHLRDSLLHRLPKDTLLRQEIYNDVFP